MPQAAEKMGVALGLEQDMAEATLATVGRWGVLEPGTRVARGPQLFPRLDIGKKQQPKKKGGNKKKEKAAKPVEGVITFDQFSKVDLRVAEIIGAEKIKKADKLLKLTLRGPEERTVVAGIAKFYQPEELVGKKVIIVANLKPAKLMGVTSQGMLLAAKDTDEQGRERLVLSTVEGEIAPGAKVA